MSLNIDFKKVIAPFRPRNVRLFIAGDFMFFLSFWIIQINLSWLIYRITESSFRLGLLGFLVNLPMVLITPFSGWLADRFNRRYIILISQTIWFVTTVLVILVTIFAKISLPIVLVAGVIYGAVFALVKPASDALVRDIVRQKGDIHRVMAVDAASNKITQFLGSAIATVIFSIFKTLVAALISSLVLNTMAFLSFFGLRISRHVNIESGKHPLKEMKQGFAYTFEHLPIWSTTVMASIALVVTVAILFQLPVFAGKVLGGSERYLHYLYFAAGGGGMAGGVLLGLRIRSKGLLKLMVLAMFILGIMLVGFAYSDKIYLSVIFMFITDGTVIFIFAACAAVIQYLVDDKLRGRVMGIFSMFCFAMIPIGNILLGALGTLVGIQLAVSVLGAFCVIAAICYICVLPRIRAQAIRIMEAMDTEELQDIYDKER